MSKSSMPISRAASQLKQENCDERALTSEERSIDTTLRPASAAVRAAATPARPMPTTTTSAS